MLAIVITGCDSQASQPKNLDTFAKCLTEQWVTMYGAPTCSYCQKQKEMFGDSFQYIDYVDCTQEPQRCGNLRGVPAWELNDGNVVEWLQSFASLAAKSNCPLPEEL